jgi:hypothetical protein
MGCPAGDVSVRKGDELAFTLTAPQLVMSIARIASLILAFISFGVHAADELPRVCRSPAGDLYGYGNRVCLISIPYRFSSALKFTKDGIAVVATRNEGHRGNMGVIDVHGNEVVPTVYDRIEIGPDGQILATRVQYNDDCGVGHLRTTMGLFDARGRVLVPMNFESLRYLHHGFAVAQSLPSVGQECSTAMQVEFVLPGGQNAFPSKFEAAGDFALNGLAAVKVGGKWGFIDTLGAMVIEARFDDVDARIHGGPPDLRQWGFGDEGLARVKTLEGYHLIDAQGRQVGPGGFVQIGQFGPEGLATVDLDTFWGQRLGLIDTRGRLVVEPTYERLDAFVNGYANVSKGGNWGFIDVHGDLVVPLRFRIDSSGFNVHGIASVLLHPDHTHDSKYYETLGYGYIDTHGKVVLEPSDYDWVDGFDMGGDGSLALVSKKGRVGSSIPMARWCSAGSRRPRRSEATGSRPSR